MYLSKSRNFFFSASPRTASHSVMDILVNSLPPADNDVAIQIGKPNLYSSIPDTYEGLQAALAAPAPVPPVVDQARYIILHHLSPANVIALGLATLEELRNMTCFGFVREPIARYISLQMLFVMLGYQTLGERTAREYIADRIREGNAVLFSLRDSFEVDGERLVTPYAHDTCLSVVNDLLVAQGVDPVAEMPELIETSSDYPELQNPLEWLPQDCIDLLRNTIMPDDFVFYEEVTS